MGSSPGGEATDLPLDPPAIGYDVDPECAGNPWRDRERRHGCGLAFELTGLLPVLIWLRRACRQRGCGSVV